jgi:putative FmdB family regulatory protein
MPIYEYECSKCGQVTEALQKFSDDPLTECSHCHGKLKKLISHNTFHLKGSGWYVTDYASKSGGTHGKSAQTGDNSTKIEAKGSGDKGTKKEASVGESAKKKDAPAK